MISDTQCELAAWILDSWVVAESHYSPHQLAFVIRFAVAIAVKPSVAASFGFASVLGHFAMAATESAKELMSTCVKWAVIVISVVALDLSGRLRAHSEAALSSIPLVHARRRDHHPWVCWCWHRLSLIDPRLASLSGFHKSPLWLQSPGRWCSKRAFDGVDSLGATNYFWGEMVDVVL